MQFFSYLSQTGSIFTLNNYCQSWIRNCQSCRKESNIFLHRFKANMNSLPFPFSFPFPSTTTPFTSFPLNNLPWMNLVREWYTRNLWANPQLFQLAAVKLHSVTPWRCTTVDVNSSLGDYSPRMNATVPISYLSLKIVVIESGDRTMVWDWAQAINSSLNFITESWTGIPQRTCNNLIQIKAPTF